jgi:hypothetical protein
MKNVWAAALLGLATLVCGCEAKIGPADGNGSSNRQGSAEGTIGLDVPGFNLKLKVPLDRATTDSQSKLLYPGSTVTGIYVAAGPDSKAGSEGEVELRFASPDAPDKIAAWYRDQSRAQPLTLTADAKHGSAFVLAGTQRDKGDRFKVRLEPKGSGTDGRLTVRDGS